MNQGKIWDSEYSNPQLVTGSSAPQNDFKRFIKWLRKDRKLSIEGLCVLDLGSGLGKNSIFLAERGAKVVGMEISKKAIEVAEERAKGIGGVSSSRMRGSTVGHQPTPKLFRGAEPWIPDQVGNDTGDARVISFLQADIGSPYAFPNNSFDLVLDIMSSNSLNEEGREVYLHEVDRVLKPGGYFFVRALCKDGDKNAENLLEKYPGKEKDVYIMPDIGLAERVFSKQDFEQTYLKVCTFVQLFKKSGYAIFKGVPYKRNYWVAYLQKEKRN